MKLPLLLINFKAYSESIGERALSLAKICDQVSKEYGVNIAVAPQFTDIFAVTTEVDIPVFAQHIDDKVDGAFTGWVSVEAVKKANAVGTLLNHSEKRLTVEEIKSRIKLAKDYALVSVCCSKDLKESERILKLKPDFIAYEPPELIGSGISVSSAKPEIVKNFVSLLTPHHDIIPLVGAGITNSSDIKTSLDFGARGVLVSSGIVKSKNQKEILEEFCKVISKY